MEMVKGMNKKINLKKFSIIVGIFVAILAGVADFTNIYDWIVTPDVQKQTSPSTNRNKGTYVSNSGIKLSVSRNDSVIIKQSYIDKDGKKTYHPIFSTPTSSRRFVFIFFSTYVFASSKYVVFLL